MWVCTEKPNQNHTIKLGVTKKAGLCLISFIVPPSGEDQRIVLRCLMHKTVELTVSADAWVSFLEVVKGCVKSSVINSNSLRLSQRSLRLFWELGTAKASSVHFTSSAYQSKHLVSSCFSSFIHVLSFICHICSWSWFELEHHSTLSQSSEQAPELCCIKKKIQKGKSTKKKKVIRWTALLPIIIDSSRSGHGHPHHNHLSHSTSLQWSNCPWTTHTNIHLYSQEGAAWVKSSIDWNTKTPHVGRWLSARKDSGTARVWQPSGSVQLSFYSSAFLWSSSFFLWVHTFTWAQDSTKLQMEFTVNSH